MSPVWAAVLFHLPGVVLFTKHRPSRDVVRMNVLALAVTAAAVVAAGLTRGALTAFLTWAVVHATWSVTLGWLVSRAAAR